MQDHVATYLDSVSDWVYEAEISTKNLGNRDVEDSYCVLVYNNAQACRRVETFRRSILQQSANPERRVLPKLQQPHFRLHGFINQKTKIYRGADKYLARPISRCILFDGENISFNASLVLYIYIYIYSTHVPPIMIIDRIYETQNFLSLQLVSFLVGLRTYQHPCTCLTGSLSPSSLIVTAI